jgi:hypothetical protein
MFQQTLMIFLLLFFVRSTPSLVDQREIQPDEKKRGI